MEAAQGSVIKIRPAEMEFAPSFQPTVVSSPANVFIQEVQAQTWTENRMVWNWRSPSSHLLCSPLIHCVFRIKIKCPYKLNRGSQIGPLLGVYDTNTALGEATAESTVMGNVPNGGFERIKGYGYRPMFSFSGGNAVMNACESKTITINGSSWSELNSNQCLRALDSCYVPDDQAQRAWSTCGGCGNRQDSVPISGHVLGLPETLGLSGKNHNAGDLGITGVSNVYSILTATNSRAGNGADFQRMGFKCIEGASMDTGLARRMQNFYDQIVKVDPAATPAAGMIYTIEIKAPISGSVFNDQWGAQGLARSDPRMRQALGLPHINTVQVVLQFKSLFKTLIRRLGRPNSVGAANLLAGAVSQHNNAGEGSDVQITLDVDYPPKLRSLFIRLPSFRSYPQSAALSVYRREIRRPSGTRSGGAWGGKDFNAGLWGGPVTSTVKGLACAGDFFSKPSALTVRPSKRTIAHHTKEVSWVGAVFPQPPSYIFICYSKDPSFTQYDNPLANIDKIAPPGVNAYGAKFGTMGNAFRNQLRSRANLTSRTITVPHIGAANAVGTLLTTFNQELAARNIAMSQDSNAAILKLEIVVQSAIGSFSFRDTVEPYLQDRDVLWRKHVRNCHAKYCPAGRGAWQDRECCALLASSDFLLGLQTSPGTAFPITLDIKVLFANRAAYRGGACFSTGVTRGQMMFEDIIIGEPTLVGLFHNNVLSIAASSAVLSSQSFSQATTAAALASS